MISLPGLKDGKKRSHDVSGPVALELRGVAKLYGGTVALRATTLDLAYGRTLALLGPNGSGKTTLLKILAGAIAPTLGSGSILGMNMVTERRRLRSEIGFLAAESYLYDDLTAVENLRFVGTMAGLRRDAAEIFHVLERVGLQSAAAGRTRTFSSGMKRRLALARALLLAPRLLLLDEPYNSMDAGGAALVDDTVRGLVESGGTVVLAAHDADRARALADVVAVLENGGLVSLAPAHRRVRGNVEHVG